jgi:hypothetical protein
MDLLLRIDARGLAYSKFDAGVPIPMMKRAGRWSGWKTPQL